MRADSFLHTVASPGLLLFLRLILSMMLGFDLNDGKVTLLTLLSTHLNQLNPPGINAFKNAG